MALLTTVAALAFVLNILIVELALFAVTTMTRLAAGTTNHHFLTGLDYLLFMFYESN